MVAITPPPLTPLPADAVLVSARRCLYQAELLPGEGEWLMRVEQRASSGLDALAAALRLPSEDKSSATACLAIGYVPIVITVSDTAGRAIQPKVPETACGAPLKAAVDAIAAVPWTTVATSKARQIRSELEISSGCSGSWKPEIPLVAAEGSGDRGSTVDTTAGPLRVCRNEATQSRQRPHPEQRGLVSHRRSVQCIHIGQRGERTAVDRRRGRAARGRGLRPTCASVRCCLPLRWRGPYIAVELGGCYRALLDNENYVRQLDAATVALLLG